MKEILKTIPKLESIDTDDAADHVLYPEDGVVIYPFTGITRNSSNLTATPASEPARKVKKKKLRLEKK